jgi:butyryl-CoA dehydrogenase
MEAGMAKLFASEVAMEIALDAIRVHGGAGYSTEYNVERYFRDAPLMIVGEGTNEIQRNVIISQLVSRGSLYPREFASAVTSTEEGLLPRICST